VSQGHPPSGFDTIVEVFSTLGTTATATEPGFSSTTTSVLSATGDTASFLAIFDQTRPAGLSTDLAVGVVQAAFTTSIDVTYVASGSYTTSGAGVSRLQSALYDYTTASYVFTSIQSNHGVPTAFTLGGMDGNFQNFLTGSMTGTLPAGHHFSWLAQTDTQATENDGGATGSGSISLVLGGSTVPEPGTLAFAGLAAIGLAVLPRRNKGAERFKHQSF
jgi:hypothetical protein